MKVDLTLLRKIDKCIYTETTGCPDCMAKNLGISKRFLHVVIDYLKKEFNAPIAYSRQRETYYYKEEWEFYIGDLKKIKSELIKGVLATIHATVKLIVFLSFFEF